MAHDNAKKNARSNASRMQLFIIISVVLVAGGAALDGLFFGRSASVTSLVLWALFWASHYAPAIFLLRAHGRPVLGAAGDIVDCVDLADPAQLGMYSYAQDVLWVCWAVHALQILVSSAAIFLYVPIPLFAVYKLFATFVSPLLAARANMAAAQQQQLMQQQQDAYDNDPRSRLQRRREQREVDRRGKRKGAQAE